jgi:serine/threonine-protein kinase
VAIHPGDILAGYRVTRLLGRGGMGEVWAAASDDPNGGEVAIKVLLARAALKPDLVRRFEREAKIASAITSPYVCQLIEVAATDDGAHLLVFERLTGESLADRLKREQYLPFSEVGPIIDDVLQGLVAAHAAGVVHRDLKPGNIFLVDRRDAPGEADDQRQRNERAKILDFGISKLTRREGEREPTLTAFDATLGSFAYMAPEQVRGAARADERADIYAVGAVAFRALSGRLPFEGNTAAVLVAMKLDRGAPSLAEATGEQWPAGIERFLERALERTRERRFDSAAEALSMWRSIQPSAIRGSAPPGAPDDVPPSRPRPALVPRAVRGPSGVIPAPTKPVLAAPIVPVAPPAPRVTLPSVQPVLTRPAMQSYQVVEDHPTDVDGPPEMTQDGPPEPDAQDAPADVGAPNNRRT